MVEGGAQPARVCVVFYACMLLWCCRSALSSVHISAHEYNEHDDDDSDDDDSDDNIGNGHVDDGEKEQCTTIGSMSAFLLGWAGTEWGDCFQRGFNLGVVALPRAFWAEAQQALS